MDNPPGDSELTIIHKVELSDRELYWIGTVIAQWAMECEIFNQTLMSFEDIAAAELPKAMNSANFQRFCSSG